MNVEWIQAQMGKLNDQYNHKEMYARLKQAGYTDRTHIARLSPETWGQMGLPLPVEMVVRLPFLPPTSISIYFICQSLSAMHHRAMEPALRTLQGRGIRYLEDIMYLGHWQGIDDSWKRMLVDYATRMVTALELTSHPKHTAVGTHIKREKVSKEDLIARPAESWCITELDRWARGTNSTYPTDPALHTLLLQLDHPLSVLDWSLSKWTALCGDASLARHLFHALTSRRRDFLTYTISIAGKPYQLTLPFTPSYTDLLEHLPALQPYPFRTYGYIHPPNAPQTLALVLLDQHSPLDQLAAHPDGSFHILISLTSTHPVQP